MDGMAAALLAAYLVLGAVAAWKLSDFARVADSMRAAAVASEEAARGVDRLSGVPFVGGSAARLAESIGTVALGLRDNAEALTVGVYVVAGAVGVSVALLPMVLVGGGYVALRRSRHRQLRTLRRMVHGDAEPLLVQHLARQALTGLPFAELRRLGGDPWRDVDEGRHLRLAAAELRRLGIPAPPHWGEAPADDDRPAGRRRPTGRHPDGPGQL